MTRADYRNVNRVAESAFVFAFGFVASITLIWEHPQRWLVDISPNPNDVHNSLGPIKLTLMATNISACVSFGRTWGAIPFSHHGVGSPNVILGFLLFFLCRQLQTMVSRSSFQGELHRVQRYTTWACGLIFGETHMPRLDLLRILFGNKNMVARKQGLGPLSVIPRKSLKKRRQQLQNSHGNPLIWYPSTPCRPPAQKA